MSKKYLIAKIDEVICSGKLNEEDKNKLIEVKKKVEQSTYLSEVLNSVTSVLIRIIGSNFDLFQ